MGSGLILDGKRVLVPGLTCISWHDDHRMRLRNEDVRARARRHVSQVILHTTKGIPGGRDLRGQRIFPGVGPSADAGERCSRTWSMSRDPGGAHLVIDHDTTVYCMADLLTEAAQHASHANQTSVGIELYQGRDAELYSGQLDAAVAVCDVLSRVLGIQRQIVHQYVGPSRRLMASVADVVGFIGHRDITNRRGLGDPGNAVINRLGAAGYEPFNFDRSEEREEWRRRQRELGGLEPDGIAGPATVERLRERGRPAKGGGRLACPHGIWVARPGDDPAGGCVS